MSYDVLPAPFNLIKLEILENDKCKCGRNRTLRHFLLVCPLGLKERSAWKHNAVLRMFKKHLDERMADINKEKFPTTEVRKKIDFHKEEQMREVTAFNISKVEDRRWGRLYTT